MLCSHFHFFAGELPKELGQLTSLTYFNVSFNLQYEKNEYGNDDDDRPIPETGFAGELPKWLCKLINLTQLFLCGNQFRG